MKISARLCLGKIEGDFAGGRIISREGAVRTDENGLAKFARDGQDKVRIDVDYDGDIASLADRASIDIDFGSLALTSFLTDGILSNEFQNVATTNAGSGTDGLTNYFDQISTIRYFNHNGKQFSSLRSVAVDQYGVINGTYDNGELRDLYQVPLAVFANPNGLLASTGNVYSQSNDSGDAIIREAGSTVAGNVRGFSLEASSVDVAQEFSDMIITQRGYSASTKVISTADEMLRELAQIR